MRVGLPHLRRGRVDIAEGQETLMSRITVWNVLRSVTVRGSLL